MARFILHIGASKCGSSSIQDFLSLNRAELSKMGYSIPGSDMELDSGGFPVMFIANLRRNVELEESRKIIGAKIKEAVDSGRDIILSAENLCDERIVPMFEGFLPKGTELVCYVRRQDDWIISSWKQWGIKLGKSADEYLDAYTRRDQPVFLAGISGWERCLSDENFHVKPMFRPVLEEGDLIRDFCKIVGIDTSGLKFPSKRTNRTFCFSLLWMLSKCPFLFSDPHDNRMFRFLELNLSDRWFNSKGEWIGLNRRMEIMNTFSDENSELKKRYFPDLDTGAYYESGDYSEKPEKMTVAALIRSSSLLIYELISGRIQKRFNYEHKG